MLHLVPCSTLDHLGNVLTILDDLRAVASEARRRLEDLLLQHDLARLHIRFD